MKCFQEEKISDLELFVRKLKSKIVEKRKELSKESQTQFIIGFDFGLGTSDDFIEEIKVDMMIKRRKND